MFSGRLLVRYDVDCAQTDTDVSLWFADFCWLFALSVSLTMMLLHVRERRSVAYDGFVSQFPGENDSAMH